MRTLSIVLMTLTPHAVFAKEPEPYKGDKCVRPTRHQNMVDIRLHEKWQSSVRFQGWKELPKASDLPEYGPQDDNELKEAQRYIFQMDTGTVAAKPMFCERGYYYYLYDSKQQGLFALMVPAYWRECMDRVREKFDLVQWVTIPNGKADNGVYELILAEPRQCKGLLKITGSKLKKALDPEEYR